MSAFDPIDFRNALGQFATGVTVITTIDDQQRPVGVTASSFNSVSIDPPLVLWSLAKNSGSLAAYQNSGHFCVHVLASTHEDLSQRLPAEAPTNLPGSNGRVAQGGSLYCQNMPRSFSVRPATNMKVVTTLFLSVRFCISRPVKNNRWYFIKAGMPLPKAKQNGEPAGGAVDIQRGTFSDNFFLYLLSRAHFQASSD